jgi:hypothetical protein
VDDWGDDPIDVVEDMAEEALRLAAILAVLIGGALFALGTLFGMWVAT